MQQQRASNGSSRWVPRPAVLAVGAAVAVAAGTSGIALSSGLGDGGDGPARSEPTWLLAPSSQSVDTAPQAKPNAQPQLAPGSGSARVPAQVAAPRTVSRSVQVASGPQAQSAPADGGSAPSGPAASGQDGVRVVRVVRVALPPEHTAVNQQVPSESQRDESARADSERDSPPGLAEQMVGDSPGTEGRRGESTADRGENSGRTDNADDSQRDETVAVEHRSQQGDGKRKGDRDKARREQQPVTTADAKDCRPTAKHLDIDVRWNRTGEITKVVISGLPVPCVDKRLVLELEMRGTGDDITVTVRVSQDREIVFTPERPVDPRRVKSVNVRGIKTDRRRDDKTSGAGKKEGELVRGG